MVQTARIRPRCFFWNGDARLEISEVARRERHLRGEKRAAASLKGGTRRHVEFVRRAKTHKHRETGNVVRLSTRQTAAFLWFAKKPVEG